jgi:hypothetical protein
MHQRADRGRQRAVNDPGGGWVTARRIAYAGAHPAAQPAAKNHKQEEKHAEACDCRGCVGRHVDCRRRGVEGRRHDMEIGNLESPRSDEELFADRADWLLRVGQVPAGIQMALRPVSVRVQALLTRFCEAAERDRRPLSRTLKAAAFRLASRLKFPDSFVNDSRRVAVWRALAPRRSGGGVAS